MGAPGIDVGPQNLGRFSPDQFSRAARQVDAETQGTSKRNENPSARLIAIEQAAIDIRKEDRRSSRRQARRVETRKEAREARRGNTGRAEGEGADPEQIVEANVRGRRQRSLLTQENITRASLLG